MVFSLSDEFCLQFLFSLQMMAVQQAHYNVGDAETSLGWELRLGFCTLFIFLFLMFRSLSGGRECSIPGPKGFPIVGCLMEFRGLQPHRRLAKLAGYFSDHKGLMALNLGSTRVIVASKPQVAKEILNSPYFADRPLKQSAGELMFGRAIGFAPEGDYWRKLRRIASKHLFSPKTISLQQPIRQRELNCMIWKMKSECSRVSGLSPREFLRENSLNTIMSCVFGYRPDNADGAADEEARELQSMVDEGFKLLGAFNWSDHIPWLKHVDPLEIHHRCCQLVSRTNRFVGKIIHQHRLQLANSTANGDDFVSVLLSLQAQDKDLKDSDIISILWEMIFRGTDTTAIVTEWILAELVLHPNIQDKLYNEIKAVLKENHSDTVQDEHTSQMSYLQAIVKESLRLHPPGPLLSWSRLCNRDSVIGGYPVAKGTHAMVNMWAITHDSTIWNNPESFDPERFTREADFDLRGNDLRLAPFGSGRRVCPGRALGLTTIHLWVARLIQEFEWEPLQENPVELDEVLKLSSEMAKPLRCRRVARCNSF